MRSAVLAISLAGCHVVSQLDNTRPGETHLAHHLDRPTPKRPQLVVGEAGVLRFVEPLQCPTERTVRMESSTEVTTGPNLATFVVGVIATSASAIVLAKGAFDHSTPLIAGGAAGLAIGLPFAIGPWLDNTRELRPGPPGASVTTPGPSEPCGERPVSAKHATLAVHGLELTGSVDAKGAFSVSPFAVVDAYDAGTLQPWDTVVTIDDRAPFTQLIPGSELAVHALEFLRSLDVDTAIAPLKLVPSLAPGLLRVSLTSNASGPLLRVVLPLQNDGPGDATGVRGRIATQSPALDGRMLYIGAIKKGQVISRELLIPIAPALAASLRDDPLALAIELRDGHGTAPSTPVRFRGVVMVDAPR